MFTEVAILSTFECLAQAFDTVVSNPQVARCLACMAVPTAKILTVEEAVAAYMDLQLRRAAAATLPSKDGQTPEANIWEVRLPCNIRCTAQSREQQPPALHHLSVNERHKSSSPLFSGDYSSPML